MNSNAQKWVATLRSREYDQAQEGLQTEKGYCCLGVACDLYMKDTGLGRWLPPAVWEDDSDSDSHQDWFYSFESDNMTMDSFTLSTAVQIWLGLTSRDGKYVDTLTDHNHSLAAWNDSGLSFVDIANIIERNSSELFERLTLSNTPGRFRT